MSARRVRMPVVSSSALQWLLDREALRQLMVDYFCGVDDRDFDRVAACFAPDVRADYGQVYSDRESLIEFIRGVRFFHTTMHGMGQQVVALDGGELSCISFREFLHYPGLYSPSFGSPMSSSASALSY